jgi:hypothetical protein
MGFLPEESLALNPPMSNPVNLTKHHSLDDLDNPDPSPSFDVKGSSGSWNQLRVASLSCSELDFEKVSIESISCQEEPEFEAERDLEEVLIVQTESRMVHNSGGSDSPVIPDKILAADMPTGEFHSYEVPDSESKQVLAL